VTPIEGLELPYWAGAWLGLYPTWEGLLAQFAALAFVLGSYVAAETVRSRRRARILRTPMSDFSRASVQRADVESRLRADGKRSAPPSYTRTPVRRG
jgi:hypothetical protein